MENDAHASWALSGIRSSDHGLLQQLAETRSTDQWFWWLMSQSVEKIWLQVEQRAVQPQILLCLRGPQSSSLITIHQSQQRCIRVVRLLNYEIHVVMYVSVQSDLMVTHFW